MNIIPYSPVLNINININNLINPIDVGSMVPIYLSLGGRCHWDEGTKEYTHIILKPRIKLDNLTT